MPFCSTCGTQIPDGATVCAACAGRAAVAPPSASAGAPGMTDNVVGMLAYFTFIPALIFILIEPYNKNRFIRFHSFQSLFFNLAWWVIWFGIRVFVHIPFFGWLAILIVPLLWIAGFIVWLILVIKANQGQMFKLPVIGDMAEKQANAM